MASTAAGAWTIKESKTHPGVYYRYNTKNGKSEWLTVENADETLTPMGGSAASGSPKGRGRRPLTRSSRATEVSWGTDDTGGGSECICTICECGKHACPLHSKPLSGPFHGNSRYREDYPPRAVAGTPKVRQAYTAVGLTPSDPDQFRSKYAEDFQTFNPDPPMSMKPQAAPPVHVPFEGTTTNKEMFCEKPIQTRIARRPISPSKAVLPFVGTTTNQESHKPFPEALPRPSMAPPQRKIASVPFDGQTQYKKDYPKRDVQAKEKKKSEAAPYEYGPPREFSTEQREAFTRKPLKYCPVLDLDPKDPSGHTGHIHYSKDHRPVVKYFPGKTPTGPVEAASLEDIYG